jgi:hypothetical protein
MNNGINPNNLWDKSKDILTMLIIPALVWVFSVSGSLKEQEIVLKQILISISEKSEKISNLEKSEREMAIKMGKLETRLDAITGKQDEINDMLRHLSNNTLP